MARIACAIVFASLIAAAPAHGFETCDHSGTTVTATFGTDHQSSLTVSGSAIVTEAGPCDGATTANTDRIDVVSSDASDKLTLDLAGGPFLGGPTNEPGGSDEIEIHLESGGGNFDVIDVLGHDGNADHLTAGRTGSPAQVAVNLNADEADGIDADVFGANWLVGLEGRGGADVLSDAGGAGTGGGARGFSIEGGPGNDTIDSDGSVRTGQGNDTVRFRPGDNASFLSYDEAPAGVRLLLEDGTGGDWGGTLAGHDGFGTTDTYVQHPFSVSGSLFADVLDGSPLRDLFNGSGGADTINGAAGDDDLAGGDGVDTMHGNADDDEIRGDAGNDFLYGDAGDDIVDGSDGDDTEDGGEGDDQLRQIGFNMSNSEELPNGKDDLRGGPGVDSLEYGEPGAPTFGGLTTLLGRIAPVTVDLDDVADDGAAGEGDNAHSDIEDLVGGVADDTLIGDDDANVLSGFDGADTLRGGGGADTLKGLGSRSGFAPDVEASADDEGDDLDGGPGADTIDANEGDDRIEAREGAPDRLDCGPGTDSGRADRGDTINADCEFLELPVEMPPDPPVTPPSVPPVVTPPVVVPPVVVPPVPKVSTLLTLPSSRRCASRRKFTVRVRREIRGTVRRVTIFVNGRRVKTVTGTRIGLPIDLRGLPKGRIRVRLQVQLADGRTATDTRTYRTCATRKRKGQFGRRRRG